MKNGTRSSKLTLVDSIGQPLSEKATGSKRVSDSDDSTEAVPAQEAQPFSPILLLFTVSIACAAAAIAAGSYGLWLARQKAARQTLTDVQDILRLCQERMQKMDAELSSLPPALSSAESAG